MSFPEGTSKYGIVTASDKPMHRPMVRLWTRGLNPKHHQAAAKINLLKPFGQKVCCLEGTGGELSQILAEFWLIWL